MGTTASRSRKTLHLTVPLLPSYISSSLCVPSTQLHCALIRVLNQYTITPKNELRYNIIGFSKSIVHAKNISCLIKENLVRGRILRHLLSDITKRKILPNGSFSHSVVVLHQVKTLLLLFSA